MPPKTPAATKPVARVLPLLGISHLDRGFDYYVTEADSAAAQPGVRVRIRFAGRLCDALVLSREPTPEFSGELRFIERVISDFVVYPPQLAALVESLADRYGGVRSDIIRSALPPRHAKAEEADFSTPWEELGSTTEPDLSDWAGYVHGQSFVDYVLGGNPARAAWQMAPGNDWHRPLAALSAKVAIDGGAVLLVVPTQRQLDELEEGLREYVSAKQITVLSNSLGPQARYRRFLSAVKGQARIVLGTRSAAFAPVKGLRLAVVVDDGNDNLVDNVKPYVHAREVLSTRAAQESASLIIAGFSRTAETQLLVEAGWMHDLVPAPATLRARMPAVVPVGAYGIDLSRNTEGGTTRLQGPAFQAMARALDRGEPVLVQSPRAGYMPILACGTCRAPARCRHCNGPIGLPPEEGSGAAGQASAPTCRWCGRIAAHHRCSECGSPRLRAMVLGQERTAEEFGRAFPSVRVKVSGGNRVLEDVEHSAQLVVATPGAEPAVRGGLYGAVILMDTGALLNRQDLRAGEDALAKWARAARLAAPAGQGGEVIVAADPDLPLVQYLAEWDFAAAAHAELSSRREVRFPPAVHMAAIDGPDAALDGFLELAELPANAEILGPVPLPPGLKLPGDYDEQRLGAPQRVLVRTPLGPRSELGRALRQANAARTSRKDDAPLRIQVDPIHIG